MDATRPQTKTLEVLDTTPPANPGAERGLLGAIILKRSCLSEAAAKLLPSDFSVPANASLYGYLLAAGNNGDSDGGDAIVLRSNLERAGLLERCGGFDYIAATIIGVPEGELPLPSKAAKYVEIISEASVARALIHHHLESVQDLYSGQRTAAEIENDYRAEAEVIVGRGSGEARFQAVDCKTLATAEYDVHFLIEETLAEFHPAIIGAAAKSCKTLLAIDAAVSLATATPFLGVEYLRVAEPVRVGYLSGEGGLSLLQDYARRVAAGRGWELADISGLVFCDSLPQLEDPQDVAALESFIVDQGLRVVVLDPLYLAFSGDDAHNLMKMGAVLSRINKLCLRNECTPILVHHTKKGQRGIDPFAPPELSDLAWAGFDAFAAQWWMISRRELYDADTPGEHKLWLNIGGRAGHSALHALNVHEGSRKDPEGRYWAVDVVKPSDAREDAQEEHEAGRNAKQRERIEEDKKMICRVVAKFPGGETKSVLKEMSGVRPQRFDVAFAELLRDGDLVPCDVFKPNRNKPYPGYKLREG